MKSPERGLAGVGEDAPRTALLCVEIDRAATLDGGQDRVLRMLHVGDSRYVSRCIPWSLDQTLNVGGYQR